MWPAGAVGLLRAGRTRPAPGTRYDAIIVLGCRVHDDGRPSAALIRRVEHACALHREGLAPRIVLSGGRVLGPVSEAEAARAHVRTHALAPEHALVIEDRSRTTRENASCTKQLLPELERVLVVTDAWHAPRARLIFAPHYREVHVAGTPGSTLRGAFREVPLYLLARVRGG